MYQAGSFILLAADTSAVTEKVNTVISFLKAKTIYQNLSANIKTIQWPVYILE